MRRRQRATKIMLVLVLILFSLLLSGCWDKVELDQLAILGMVGIDYDPENELFTVYYQVISPFSGASSLETGGAQSPVYTYAVSGPSQGEIRTLSNQWMSRRVFESHLRVMVISQRAAKHKLKEIVDHLEALPRGRASIFIVVAEQIEEVMKHFTLLERLPGEDIDARLKFLQKNSLFVGQHIRIRDLSERMAQGNMVVLPKLVLLPGRSETVEQRETNINANQDNFIISGGAVIQNYRLTGQMDDHDLVCFHLLAGERGQHTKKFHLNGKELTVTIQPVFYKQTVALQNQRPVVTIHLDIELSISRAIEFVPETYQGFLDLEQQVERTLEDELTAFYHKAKEKGWDVIGMKDILRRNLPDYKPGDDVLDDADVEIVVHVSLTQHGQILRTH